MARNERKWARIAALFLCVWCVSPGARGGQPARYEENRLSMACAWTIVAHGDEEKSLPGIVAAAFDEIDRIDRLMSHYKPESPLSRINREAGRGPVVVEPELFDFLADCLRYSRDSNGAFDVTVGPLMKAWGFFRGEGRMPTRAELAAARGKIGYRHVLLDPAAGAIRFDREGVELDLGGIAKGYAVDRAVAVLRSRGISRALVNGCGSTIYGLGAPPGETGWELKLQDPLDPKRSAMTVRLKDRALSVSGSYEKFFRLNGRRYSHIMDPRTGLPVQGVLSVAVLATDGTAGDALDNVYYVQGPAWSRANLARFPATREAIFFLSAGADRTRTIRLRSGSTKE
ncbi:MAG: FAD:protein FMN transferase [Blastocatellia bacterium]|nr:FAD:protein FMN transferase [Blastocatellia bacterium]